MDMEQPEGFSAPGQSRKVYKLVKSLYGLKQAPKQWHEKFDNVMLSNGLELTIVTSVFMSKTLTEVMSFCVYMLMICSL